MKKSRIFSEQFCDALCKRMGSYSNSNTLEGQLDAVTSIVIDLGLVLLEKGLVNKKDLMKITEKYPQFED